MARKIATIKPMVATIMPPAIPGPRYACDAVGNEITIRQNTQLTNTRSFRSEKIIYRKKILISK